MASCGRCAKPFTSALFIACVAGRRPTLTVRVCYMSQAAGQQGAESMQVQLGAMGQQRTRLGGFKSRALKAEAPRQHHLYVTAWCALEAAAEASGRARLPVLVLGGGESVLGSNEHDGAAAWHTELDGSVHAVQSQRRDGGAWAAVAAAVQEAFIAGKAARP